VVNGTFMVQMKHHLVRTLKGMTKDGIDAARLQTVLEVLRELDDLDPDHPDAVLLRRATAHVYKSVKLRRRSEKRATITAADEAVTNLTATGAGDRIDDETRGVPLRATAETAVVGTLHRARACYVCKNRYREVDAFYHQLCPSCAATNAGKRDESVDLSGRRALLTGGRAKIGMYIALRLLRDGAELTITTRFPHDAVRRFTAMPDSATWLHRLKVVGIDLRDPHQVIELAEDVAADGHLDVLINNAAQTVRRSQASYAQLAAAEHAAEAIETTVPIVDLRSPAAEIEGAIGRKLTPEAVTALALTSGSASLARVEQGIAIDAGGLVPDLDPVNSWSRRVHEVDAVEMLEVQLCNSVAPFILISRLRPSLAASPHRRTYVVNVSAMEGQFGRRYKGAGHPHTNMAKAALNMLTRTSAEDMFAERILMTAVDTGWITDERPHPTKARLHDEGFHAPLDLVDGAARVYDPIVQGERGTDLYGCFLKDFQPSPW
jgi:NAD(P)-dependent dehydrogenase (short-subunit alcohol dehydrogenase family)